MGVMSPPAACSGRHASLGRPRRGAGHAGLGRPAQLQATAMTCRDASACMGRVPGVGTPCQRMIMATLLACTCCMG